MPTDIFVTRTKNSNRVVTFNFMCMSGNFTIKLRKSVWSNAILYFNHHLKSYKSLHEIGEILLDITHSREKIKGVYNGIDFLTYLGVKKI